MNTDKEEFINKLSIETELSYLTINDLILCIETLGNLENAINIYKNDGISALLTYKNQLTYGFI